MNVFFGDFRRALPAAQGGSMSPPISRFPVPALTDWPDDVRERILAVRGKSGFRRLACPWVQRRGYLGYWGGRRVLCAFEPLGQLDFDAPERRVFPPRPRRQGLAVGRA